MRASTIAPIVPSAEKNSTHFKENRQILPLKRTTTTTTTTKRATNSFTSEQTNKNCYIKAIIIQIDYIWCVSLDCCRFWIYLVGYVLLCRFGCLNYSRLNVERVQRHKCLSWRHTNWFPSELLLDHVGIGCFSAQSFCCTARFSKFNKNEKAHKKLCSFCVRNKRVKNQIKAFMFYSVHKCTLQTHKSMVGISLKLWFISR